MTRVAVKMEANVLEPTITLFVNVWTVGLDKIVKLPRLMAALIGAVTFAKMAEFVNCCM